MLKYIDDENDTDSEEEMVKEVENVEVGGNKDEEEKEEED